MIPEAAKRIGLAVASAREGRKLTQDQLAERVHGGNRTAVAHLEQGIKLPNAEILEGICVELNLPRPIWEAALDPDYLLAIEFQDGLGELLGKPVAIDLLDPASQKLAVSHIAQLFRVGMSVEQSHNHFNSVLTFYGEKPASVQFFERFLGPAAFVSLDAFKKSIQEYQKTAVRLFGSFRYAFKTLRACPNVDEELATLRPIDAGQFTKRRPFKSVQPIPVEHLDDLGYIAVQRVRLESRERHELKTKLEALAAELRKDPQALSRMGPKKVGRVQTLLRKFDSSLEVAGTLFSTISPDILEAEAIRIAPQDADLARIEETQEKGLSNLAAYLSEPHMDVYVATSMRERADFVSVNAFVQTVFSHPEIAHLNLRYFNPTQSWISDRVAKGLVEALMLRRAELTVYMAQKGDTFGKDSEASVALGQGKPVVVYVPKLVDPIHGIDSERLWAADDAELGRLRDLLKLEDEEGADRQADISRILQRQLDNLDGAACAQLYHRHWSDFDLPSELTGQDEDVVASRKYLAQLTSASDAMSVQGPDAKVARVINQRLVKVAVVFEKRATTFREIHPLALQVIISTGVLNGILVVRSPEGCAKIMHRLLTNTIETDLLVDDNNYKLVERQTGSTLRVISKHRLLTNAFWTQYFDDHNTR